MKLHAYRYIGAATEHVTVVADEVRRVNPHTVFRIGALNAVDYHAAVEA